MTLRSDRRLAARRDPLLTEKVVFAIGPQHPSLPAPVRLLVQADGELMERISIECGYMHRGVERLCRERSYSVCAALLSRCEWLAGMNADYLVSAAVEQLGGIEVPDRAQWLRMAALELSRIVSHLFWWGQLGLEAGAITPVFWAMRERELALDLLEALSGHRWHHGWIVPGGVRCEPPEWWAAQLGHFIAVMYEALEHYENFYSDNAIWINRSEMIGVLETEYAVAYGAGGPVLRGCGVQHDLRRDAPYLKYDEVEFAVPVGEYGDCLDRYRVRMQEIRESLKILAQCVEHIGVAAASVAGTIETATEVAATGSVGQAASLPTTDAGNPALGGTAPLEVPKGETYVAVEGPRGELGLMVVSDGTDRPARMHLRGPSLAHLHLLNELCRGYLLADLFVILGSLDIMIGEVDR